MRLSDRLVLQVIERVDRDDDYVLVDDHHGTEIVLTPTDVARLLLGIEWFAANNPHFQLANAIDGERELLKRSRWRQRP
jgi:hypothetical protein